MGGSEQANRMSRAGSAAWHFPPCARRVLACPNYHPEGAMAERWQQMSRDPPFAQLLTVKSPDAAASLPCTSDVILRILPGGHSSTPQPSPIVIAVQRREQTTRTAVAGRKKKGPRAHSSHSRRSPFPSMATPPSR